MGEGIIIHDDEHWMRHALREAEAAFAADEVPRTLGSDKQSIDTLRWFDLTEVQIETVRAHQDIAGL